MVEQNLYVGKAIRQHLRDGEIDGEIDSSNYPIIASSKEEAKNKLLSYLNSTYISPKYRWVDPHIRELNCEKENIPLETRVEIVAETLDGEIIR